MLCSILYDIIIPMLRHKSIIVPVAVMVLTVSGCAKTQGADEKVLARVSSHVITAKDLKSKISRLPPYYQSVVAKDPKRYVEEIIVEMLCYEEGVRKGLDRDKEVKELVNEAKKKIVTAKLVKNEVEDKVVITEDEIKKFYDENKEKFKTPEMWRVSHILVPDEAAAKKALDDIAAGAKFEDIARERSIDATASRGGDVGFFRLGQLVPEFESACLKLEPGKTSGIVKTQFGYHIIKMTGKKESGVMTYLDARKAIEAELKKQKRAELFAALVLKLKDKYGVEVNESAFPKEAQGTAPAK